MKPSRSVTLCLQAMFSWLCSRNTVYYYARLSGESIPPYCTASQYLSTR